MAEKKHCPGHCSFIARNKNLHLKEQIPSGGFPGIVIVWEDLQITQQSSA